MGDAMRDEGALRTKLSRLGRRVDEDQARAGEGPADAGERERFLAAALGRAAHRRKRRASLALAVAAALAALALVAVLVGPGLAARRPLGVSIGGVTADAGAFVAPRGEAEAVRFSDGTTFGVEAGGRVRVASVEPSGARLVLEDGELHASVVHRPGARWVVGGGPFEVLVTGTRFDVRWDAGASLFFLRLVEGSVKVSGPLVGEGLAVASGDTLVIRQAEGRFELRRDGEVVAPIAPLASAPAALPPAVEASGRPASGPPVPAPPPSAPAPRPLPRSPRPSWREHATAGRFREAMEAATLEGFERLLDEGGAADLRDLGDAARLSGDTTRARRAFTRLRERFPGGEPAAEAAFLLGVLSFDATGGEAARWFDAYLRERPAGRLAREASGRLLEVSARGPDRALAKAAAGRYLRDYPDGPHAEMARAIVAE